jgi:DNA-binding MarR family transcriptional regulator
MSTPSTPSTAASSAAADQAAARGADLRRIESELGILIRRVKRVLGERARMLHPDMQPITFFLLTHVIERGPVRAADLVGAFGMDKGGVSRQVQHLVDNGFVERRPDPDDRRATLLVATEDAVRRVEEMQQARSDRFDQRLSDWSDADLTRFADQLAAYNAALAD